MAPVFDQLWGDAYWRSLPTNARLADLDEAAADEMRARIRIAPVLPTESGDFAEPEDSGEEDFPFGDETPDDDPSDQRDDGSDGDDGDADGGHAEGNGTAGESEAKNDGFGDSRAYGEVNVDIRLADAYETARDYLSDSPQAKAVLLAFEHGIVCGPHGRVKTQLRFSPRAESSCVFDFKRGRMVVDWNPDHGLMDVAGQTISPALILFHELVHGVHFAQDAISHMLRRLTVSDKAMNLEEELAIGHERDCAHELGEGTRDAGYGVMFPVQGVRSRTPEHPDRTQFHAFMKVIRTQGKNTHFERIDKTKELLAKRQLFFDYFEEQYAMYLRFQSSQYRLRDGLESPEVQDAWRSISWNARAELVQGKCSLADFFPQLKKALQEAGME